MYKYNHPMTCDICNKVRDCYHFDIYHSGSEGTILCIPCMVTVLTNCEKEENITARRELGRIIANLSLTEFKNRWAKMAERED